MDYSLIIYVGDAFYLVTIVLTLFFKISMSDVRKSDSLVKTFSRTINRSTLLMFGFCLCRGINKGVGQSYQAVYLTEELGASPELIGGMTSIALAVGVVAAAVAKPLLQRVGAVNLVFCGLLAEGVQYILYSLVKYADYGESIFKCL